jgi:hydrogenase nickel incorporation protein HypA/HybF
MHELSIAMSIVEMAEREAVERDARVTAVYMKLGLLAGVVKEALLSSYEMASAGTIVEGSRLVIEDVPILVNCPACQEPRLITSDEWFVCPECKGPVSGVLEGREMEVVALEIEEKDLKNAPVG